MLSRMVKKGDCVRWPPTAYDPSGTVYRVTRIDGNLAHIETLDGKNSTLFIAKFHDGLNKLVEIVEVPGAEVSP